MGFTHGKTKIGKKKYKIFVNLDNEEKPFVEDYKLKEFASFYDEVYITENNSTIQVKNNGTLFIVTDNDIDKVTFDADSKAFFLINKKNNKESLFLTIMDIDIAIDYNETFFSVDDFRAKNYLPIGACLNDLTLNDTPGEPIEFLSGERLMHENTTNVSFILPSIPTDLIETIRDFDNVGLLFLSTNDNTHFYINNLTPFIGMQIQTNELNQTVITIEQTFPLEFIQVFEEEEEE